jgi:ABC-type sugar transport system permease subunit
LRPCSPSVRTTTKRPSSTAPAGCSSSATSLGRCSRPRPFLLLILNVIYSFQVFDLIFVMTGGGPGFATTMLVQYIYQSAFVTSQMGYACAMGMALFVLIVAFTILQWRLSRQDEIAARGL